MAGFDDSLFVVEIFFQYFIVYCLRYFSIEVADCSLSFKIKMDKVLGFWVFKI